MEGPPEDQGLPGPGRNRQKQDDRNKVPSGDAHPALGGVPGPARFRQSPELRNIPLTDIEFLNLGGEFGNISDHEKTSLTSILKSDSGPSPGSRPNKRPFLWHTPPATKPDQVEQGPGLDFGVSEVFNSLSIQAPEFIAGPPVPPTPTAPPMPSYVQGIPVPGGAKHIHINNFTANINYHGAGPGPPTDPVNYHTPPDNSTPPSSLPAQPGLPMPFTATAGNIYPGAYVAPFPQSTPPGHYTGPSPYPSMMMYNPVPVVTFSTSPYFPNGQMSPSPTHHLEQGLQATQQPPHQKEVRPKPHESITFGNSCPVVSVLQKDTSSDEEVVEDEINKMRYREGGQPPSRHVVEGGHVQPHRDQGPRQAQPPFSKETHKSCPQVHPNQPQSQMPPQNTPMQHPTHPQVPPTIVPSMHQYPPASPAQPLAYAITNQTPPTNPQMHCMSPPPTKPAYTPQPPRTENAVKRTQEIYTPQPPRTENAVKRSQPESYSPQPPKSENVVKRPQPEAYIPQAPKTENAVKRAQQETYPPQPTRAENAMKRIQQPLPESCTPQPPKTENAVKRSPPQETSSKPAAPALTPSNSTKPEPSPKPSTAPEPEEASGPKSWASLFSSNSAPGGPANLLPVDKPTARIPPFSAQVEGVERVGEAGGSRGPTSQEKELGHFLRSYKLNHMAPSFLPRGLTNRSNWCFVNAILQSLQACPPFYNMLKALPLTPLGLRQQRKSTTPIIDSVVEFVSEFSTLEVMNKIEKKDKSRKKQDLSVGNPFEASYVYRMLLTLESETFKVIEGRQEDAEEFLTCLLNGLSDEMLGLLKLTEEPVAEAQPEVPNQQPAQPEGAEWHEVGAKGRGSCVTRRVVEGGGQHETSIMQLALGLCRSCVKSDGGETSATLQPFYTLQLDIQHANVTSVTEALAANFSSEQLDGYICSRTKVEVEASRSVSLEELPPILILHLKRFVYDSATGGVQKVMKNVEFTVDLDIDKSILSASNRTKFTTKQRQYKLFAVVYHNGREATKGHYVSDVYHTGYATWLHCDDSSVKPTAEGLVTTPAPNSTPYILFYRRCDTMVGMDKTQK